MQLTQATDYALRTILCLAGLAPGEVLSAQEIAGKEEIPLRFLFKIMRPLVKNGIVKSFRGTAGGFALARPPATITLLDVVEVVEGPIRLNRCLIDEKYCTRRWADRCPVRRVLENIQNAVIAELGRCTFADLVKSAQKV